MHIREKVRRLYILYFEYFTKLNTNWKIFKKYSSSKGRGIFSFHLFYIIPKDSSLRYCMSFWYRVRARESDINYNEWTNILWIMNTSPVDTIAFSFHRFLRAIYSIHFLPDDANWHVVLFLSVVFALLFFVGFSFHFRGNAVPLGYLPKLTDEILVSLVKQNWREILYLVHPVRTIWRDKISFVNWR